MDLYERIKRIKEAQKQGRRSPDTTGGAGGAAQGSRGTRSLGAETGSGGSAGPSTEAPGGSAGPSGEAPGAAGIETGKWEQHAPRVWTRSLSYELPPAHGMEEGPHPGIGSGGRFWEDYLYIDSETTGLSSGAGTLVFLFGCGSFVPGGFRLIQWFLSDFPGETDFLKAVLRGLGSGGRILASYNGRSFDMPLLASRCILNGLPPAAMPHLDLLHSSRSLFRESLERCNLGTIEEHVLGIVRGDDIPGSEIPERYFAHQRSFADLPPDADPELAPVLSHHAQDIVSLGLLHRRISGLISTAAGQDPGTAGKVDIRSGTTGEAAGGAEGATVATPAPATLLCGGVRASARGLAIHLIRAGMKDEAGRVLQRFSRTRQDLRLQADLLRESRGPEAAVPIWERLYLEFHDPAAFRALLIHTEHRRKDFKAALQLLERDGSGLLETDERERRQERLLRKLMNSREP